MTVEALWKQCRGGAKHITQVNMFRRRFVIFAPSLSGGALSPESHSD